MEITNPTLVLAPRLVGGLRTLFLTTVTAGLLAWYAYRLSKLLKRREPIV
jgi:hypothetical protein